LEDEDNAEALRTQSFAEKRAARTFTTEDTESTEQEWSAIRENGAPRDWPIIFDRPLVFWGEVFELGDFADG
jgi:hypothetical protein